MGEFAALTYRGDLSVHEAWDMLASNPNATLVDVRTEREWQEIGVPDISTLPNKFIQCSWRTLPGMELNPDFIQEISTEVTDQTSPLLLICKLGPRSQEAAQTLAEAGHSACYNIIGGFEGETQGWKTTQLPWRK